MKNNSIAGGPTSVFISPGTQKERMKGKENEKKEREENRVKEITAPERNV